MRRFDGFLVLLMFGSGCEYLSNQRPSPAPAPACPAPEPIGRFQLFQGTVRAGYKNSDVNEPTVFRIDTVTGKVSEYIKFYNTKTEKEEDFWTAEEL